MPLHRGLNKREFSVNVTSEIAIVNIEYNRNSLPPVFESGNMLMVKDEIKKLLFLK